MHTVADLPRRGTLRGLRLDVLAQLKANGQIATQYVDEAGEPAMDLDVQPERFGCWPSKASPARTAACSARWATPSATATVRS